MLTHFGIPKVSALYTSDSKGGSHYWPYYALWYGQIPLDFMTRPCEEKATVPFHCMLLKGVLQLRLKESHSLVDQTVYGNITRQNRTQIELLDN